MKPSILLLVVYLLFGCTITAKPPMPTSLLPHGMGDYNIYVGLEEAYTIYMHSPNASVVKEKAFTRWCDLATRLALKVTDAYESKFVFEKSPDTDRCDAKKIVLAHWRQLSRAEIARITTLEEARQAWINAPKDSKEEAQALKRWHDFSEEELKDAKIFPELEEAIKRAHQDTPSYGEKRYLLDLLKQSIRHI